LVLLTNVDGFMRGRGGQMPAELEPFVERVTSEIRSAAGPSRGAPIGRGGMKTKIEAAEIAMNCGGVALIANGSNPVILESAFGKTALRLPRGCAGKRRGWPTRQVRRRGGGRRRATGNHRRQSEFVEFGGGAVERDSVRWTW
jgi:glutamate 5-kinase